MIPSLYGVPALYRSLSPPRATVFTVDSILLADFCRIKPKDRVLEPGAGTGLSLSSLRKAPRAAFTAVEVQTQLADLCEQNIVGNSLDGRITVIARTCVD